MSLFNLFLEKGNHHESLTYLKELMLTFICRSCSLSKTCSKSGADGHKHIIYDKASYPSLVYYGIRKEYQDGSAGTFDSDNTTLSLNNHDGWPGFKFLFVFTILILISFSLFKRKAKDFTPYIDCPLFKTEGREQDLFTALASNQFNTTGSG